MDHSNPTPTKPSPEAYYTPLLTSLICIVSCCIALLIYHFIIGKYTRWRARNTVPPPRVLATVPGVEQKMLDSLPVIIYSLKNRQDFYLDQPECAVCLGDMEEDDMVRLLPMCKHVFHVPCIDQWFEGNKSCPLCRLPVGEQERTNIILLPIEVRGSENDVVDEDTDTSLAMGPTRFLFRHCASMVLGRERRERLILNSNLKRSLSMDQFFVAIDIERETNWY